MSDFNNRVDRPDFMEAFRQGFVEGQVMATEEPVYEVEVSFEGVPLNRSTYDDLKRAMGAVEIALDTPGVKVTIEFGTSTPPAPELQAVAAQADDEVVDAEIVG